MDFKKSVIKNLVYLATISSILIPTDSLSFKTIKDKYKDQYPNGVENEMNRIIFSDHPLIIEAAINAIQDPFVKKEAEDFQLQLYKGVINEDFPISRAWNHFYDPTDGSGLPMVNLLARGIVNIFPTSALKWSIGGDPESLGIDNYSLTLAIANYRMGDKELAYENLGHFLHTATQDLGVIDHVTENFHPDGSIFEDYIDEFYVYPNSRDITVIRYPNFEDYVIESASFTLKVYQDKFGSETSIWKEMLTGNENNLANLKLTNEQLESVADIIMPHVIGTTAGAIEHFYELVNK
ncbi:hypothetical protein CL617_01240 [archaeon]|nr:hypothetical protein [archaeon]|tara:strand:+ start:6658 stop:7539 length:882 start_codon:yes stop_codon:yes gene_type:complete